MATDDVIAQTVAPGCTVFVQRQPVVHVVGDGGEIEELCPDEHPGWVDVGTTHGRPQSPDEEDVDGNDFLNSRVGRIGSVYFEQIIDPWEQQWLGVFESDGAALAWAAGTDFDIQH